LKNGWKISRFDQQIRLVVNVRTRRLEMKPPHPPIFSLLTKFRGWGGGEVAFLEIFRRNA
jgi:hypothetical protein